VGYHHFTPPSTCTCRYLTPYKWTAKEFQRLKTLSAQGIKEIEPDMVDRLGKPLKGDEAKVKAYRHGKERVFLLNNAIPTMIRQVGAVVAVVERSSSSQHGPPLILLLLLLLLLL
jgi:hypothetical protein